MTAADQPPAGVALKPGSPEHTADLITKAINGLNPSMGEVRVSVPAMKLALERFAYSLRTPASGAVEADGRDNDLIAALRFAAEQNADNVWGALGRQYGPRILAALTSKPKAEGAREWSEHEDEISDALDDSLDMDWTSRVGARAVVRYLNSIGGQK